MNKYIILHCYDCDYLECDICKSNTYIAEDSKKGCTRQVPEELYIKYYHNINEVLPFFSMYKYDTAHKLYNEIMNDNYQVYNCPLGKIITRTGYLLDQTSKDSIETQEFHEE